MNLQTNSIVMLSLTTPIHQAHRLRKSWSFDLNIHPSIASEVEFILGEPMVFELYGAGFTRSRGSKLYELRFPRVSAIHTTRKPDECVTLEEMQKMGRDCSSTLESEAEEEIGSLWSRCSSDESGWEEEEAGQASTGAWRGRQEQEWVEKLFRADRPKKHKRKKSASSPRMQIISRRPYARRTIDDQALATSKALLVRQGVGRIDLNSKDHIDCTDANVDDSAPNQLLPALAPESYSSTVEDAEQNDLSTIISERSLLSVDFIKEEGNGQVIWTVYPRHSLPKDFDGRGYGGRVHSLGAFLRQLGFQPSGGGSDDYADLSVRPARVGIIFTDEGRYGEVRQHVLSNWTRAGCNAQLSFFAIAGLTSPGGERGPRSLLASKEIEERYRLGSV